MKALTGYVILYNRFPHTYEFTADSRPYQFDPHEYYTVTYELAWFAVKQSMFHIGKQGEEMSQFGVVPQSDPDFGKPLEKADLTTGDPLKDYPINLAPYDEQGRKLRHEYVSIDVADVLPKRRGQLDSVFTVLSKNSQGG